MSADVKSVLEYFSDFYLLSSFGVSSFDPSSSRLGALEPKTFALRILSISSCCLSNLLFSAMLVNRLGVIKNSSAKTRVLTTL